MNDNKGYSYETYAEFYRIKKQILDYYFLCIEKYSQYHFSKMRGRNSDRRLREFKFALNQLFLSIAEKVIISKNEKVKIALKEFKAYSKDPNALNRLSPEETYDYFLKVQIFLRELGITRIEKKRLPEEMAFAEIDEDES